MKAPRGRLAGLALNLPPNLGAGFVFVYGSCGDSWLLRKIWKFDGGDLGAFLQLPSSYTKPGS